ncbi:MAG: ankyrin repeat domain-containing protein [Planctomycetes bacterium]|nr:ankyrin repeat domain-containing protein [Planctomycetota bacterium]
MVDRKFHGIRASSRIDAFGIAAANSLFREMRSLLEDGVDINGVASYSKSTALATAAGYGLIRSVNFLLDNGANIEIPGANAMTPLMHTCSCGKAKGSRVALRLIEANANVSYVRQSDEMTALKFAVHDCKPDVIQALIDAGADVDGPPGTDQTALMIAACANHVDALKVLVKNGANRSLPCKLRWAENRTARELAELEKCRKAATYFASLPEKG